MEAWCSVGWLQPIECLRVVLPSFFHSYFDFLQRACSQTISIKWFESIRDRFVLQVLLYGEFNWKYGKMDSLCWGGKGRGILREIFPTMPIDQLTWFTCSLRTPRDLTTVLNFLASKLAFISSFTETALTYVRHIVIWRFSLNARSPEKTNGERGYREALRSRHIACVLFKCG